MANKKIKVSGIPVGGNRGSDHVDRVPVIGHKRIVSHDPKWDYFAGNFTISNLYTKQESQFFFVVVLCGHIPQPNPEITLA